jgi:pyruvate kinase
MKGMDYEIIATLGPESSSEPVWMDLLTAGASSFRLNTSHLALEQIDRWLDRIRTFLLAHDAHIHLILDLQGSKWRLGDFPGFTLEPGQQIELICAPSSETAGMLPVPHQDFFQAALSSDGTIVLNDARIVLAMEKADALTVKARVVRGGGISPQKGITCSSSSYRIESLGEKDREILERMSGMDGIRYALSYVRDAVEMSRYRTMINGGAYLIAKLERGTALEDAGRIALLSDELWLCRGDLGAEMGPAAMAEAVHGFSGTVGSLPRPVLMAGQVLEHMTLCPVPTRSEVCFLYDALAGGYGGIVLSDETAVGRYPVESCRAAAMFRAVASR